ncbi:hypothetical protein IW261DRAFT_377772 [Armillaria novae-zelandiae]|uniref:C2H2-type domain-containing protein n=1 Tax=Armillaria novae-zelandiae TaxID=153914 RepID=A0AA39UGW1_9AGAR|nr:hypothetical protein IW261DRAFT_377772 [Armillaria novae-zelandiae]
MTNHLTVELTDDAYLAISKTTVVRKQGPGLRCDHVSHGKDCGGVLSCWQAMSNHLFVHCICRRVHDKRKSVKQVQYECPLQRCSAPIHGSEQSIRDHIDESHMPAFHALICPFRQCEEISFQRPSHLMAHLHEAHAALKGQRLDLHSELFLPSSRIFRSSCIPDPPLLRVPRTGTVLVSEVVAGPLRKPLSWGGGASQTPRPSMPRTPQKLKHTASESLMEDDKNISDIILDDLPTYDHAKFSSLQTDFVLWHRPPQLRKDVARPLPMLDSVVPRPTEPPTSILYKSFKRCVDALAQQIETGAPRQGGIIDNVT